MLESYKWMDGIGIGYGYYPLGRKSLYALILRVPLCGAKNII